MRMDSWCSPPIKNKGKMYPGYRGGASAKTDYKIYSTGVVKEGDKYGDKEGIVKRCQD